MTKVSIIVPFHNVERYISKCLTSLVCQSLDDIEIICVNDASTDNSKNIVLDYMEKDNRIKLLETETLSGQSYARNLALDVAIGEYIGFVDSDDWVETTMFEKMYNRAKYADADITMCQAHLYDDVEQSFYTDDYYSLKPLEKFGERAFCSSDTKSEILQINVVLWNKIYKRNFIQNNKMKFQNGFIYEDMPFFFQTYLKAKNVNVLWESLYYYRQNRSFSTMQNSDKKVYDRIPMVEFTYNILKEADFFDEEKSNIISWIIDDIFHRYTLLEDKYYENYYQNMQKFFRSIEITDKDREVLAKSYCYDEFCNIVERSYFGFWRFLIEKYKTSNKRIKAAEHKCNLDVQAIKDYLEQYKKEQEEEKKEIVKWWQDNCNQKLTEQEYALKSWQAESVKQITEKLTADYEWKLESQKQHYMHSLNEQKNYYENNYLLVKILLKFHKKMEQLQNKFKKIIKKN